MLRNPLHIVALFQITKQIIEYNNSLGAGHWSEARLAQSTERKALNLVVVGSSPTVGVLCRLRVVLVMRRGLARRLQHRRSPLWG